MVCVCIVSLTSNALLLALMLMGEVRDDGGGEAVSGSVATSVSPVPAALTISWLKDATPFVPVLALLPLSVPMSPAPSARTIAIPPAGKAVPLSSSCTAAAKPAFGRTLAGGHVLKLSA